MKKISNALEDECHWVEEMESRRDRSGGCIFLLSDFLYKFLLKHPFNALRIFIVT